VDLDGQRHGRHDHRNQQKDLVDGSNTPATALLRVDLSSIPANATVIAAELHVTTSNDTGDPCSVYELLEAWSESRANWNDRLQNARWSGQGATPPSRGTVTVAGPIDTSDPLAARVVALDAAMVNRWVAAPSANHGVALVMTSSDGATFRTREDPTASQRPFLRVTYVAGR
jgi:hypothetical protein